MDRLYGKLYEDNTFILHGNKSLVTGQLNKNNTIEGVNYSALVGGGNKLNNKKIVYKYGSFTYYVDYNLNELYKPTNINPNYKYGYVKNNELIYTNNIVDILFETQVYLNIDDINTLIEYDFKLHKNKQLFIFGPNTTTEIIEYICFNNDYKNNLIYSYLFCDLDTTKLNYNLIILNKNLLLSDLQSVTTNYINPNLITKLTINQTNDNSEINMPNNYLSYFNNLEIIYINFNNFHDLNVGIYAFCYLPKLRQLILNCNYNNIETICTKNYVLVKKNNIIKLFKYYPINKSKIFKIPNNVTYIYNDAFCCNNYLEIIELPNNSKITFDEYSLELIPNLKQIIIPKSSEILIKDNKKIIIPSYYPIANSELDSNIFTVLNLKQ